MKALAWMIAAACLLAPAPDSPETVHKKELEKLQGTWKMQSLKRDGEEAPADFVADKLLTFDGEKVLVDNRQGTCKLDAAKKPAQIDLTSDDKKDPDIHGIYKVDGDTLTIAFAKPGKDRPTEFVSKPGSGVALTVFGREKK